MDSHEKVSILLSFWTQLGDVLGLEVRVWYPAGDLEELPRDKRIGSPRWEIQNISSKFWKKTVSKMLPKGIMSKRRAVYDAENCEVRIPARMSYKEFKELRSRYHAHYRGIGIYEKEG